MQSRFFLPGIVPDVTWIAHAFAVRFLEPLVKLILVLVEPVTAKDIPPRKRCWGRFPAVLQDHVISKVDDDIPVPGGGECIGRVQHPRRARNLVRILTALLSFCNASLIVGQKPVHYKIYRDSKLVSLLVYHFFAQQRL